MKTKKIVLLYLRNSEHFEFHTEFRDLVTKIITDISMIKPQLDTFFWFLTLEDEALKKITKSALTEELMEADRKRDELFRGMVDINSGALHHFLPEVAEAAKRLKIVFDTYGNLAKRTSKEETTDIYNLLQEFKTNYAEDLKKVHLEEWITALEMANVEYRTLSGDRLEESTHRTDIQVKEIRAKVDEAYHIITERIDAIALIEGGEEYEIFIQSLNKLIEEYTHLLAQRKGIAKAKKEKNKDEQNEQV